MNTRMTWLLALMAVLAVARVLIPSGGAESAAVVPALQRDRPPVTVGLADSTATARLTLPEELDANRRDEDIDEPRNAFELRQPPAPPKPTPVIIQPHVTRVAMPSPSSAPALTDPPAPNVQIIGTWLDAQGPSVFVSTSGRVLQVRAGDLVPPEYRVVQIDPSSVLLRDLRAERDVRLNLPAQVAAAR